MDSGQCGRNGKKKKKKKRPGGPSPNSGRYLHGEQVVLQVLADREVRDNGHAERFQPLARADAWRKLPGHRCD